MSSTLTLAFIGMSVAALLVSGAVGIFFLVQTQKEAVEGKHRVVAQQAADAVAGFVSEKFSLMEAAVRLTRTDRQRTSAVETLLGMEPAFRQIILLDTENQPLARVSRMSRTESERLDVHLGSDPVSKVEGRGRHIGSVYVDQVTSEPLVLLYVPVVTLLGDELGVLVAEVNLKFIWKLMERLQVGETGHAYVVDRMGRLIAFGDISRVLKGETLGRLEDVSAFIHRREKEEAMGVHRFVGITGKTVVGTCVPLNDPDWAVMTELPVREAYRPVLRNGVISAVILLVISAAAGWLGFLLARRLAAPIVGLTRAAGLIAAGDLDVKVDMKGPVEVIRLSEAFNIMTRQLGHMLDREAERARALELEISRRQEVQNALEQSEQRLKDLIANVPGVVYQYQVESDLPGSSSLVSMARERALEVLGLDSRAENFYAAFSACIPEYDRSRFEMSVSEAVKGEKPWHYEGQFIKPSGETIWFEGHALPRRVGGDLIYYGVLTDITRRKDMESSLHLTQLCFDKASFAIYRIDEEGRILGANEQACAKLGYTHEELCRLTIFDIDPDYDPARYNAIMEKVSNRHALTIETRHRCRSGDIYPARLQLNYTRYENQKFIVVFEEDITLRKQAEQALKESEQRLELALSGANEGIWDWRIDEDVLYLDDRYFTMAGYEPGEFPYHFDEIMKRVHPDDAERVSSTNARYLAGELETFGVEFRFRRKDGGYIWIQAKGKIVSWDERGNPTRFAGTHADISERKRIEESLRLTQFIFDKAPIGIWRMGQEGEILDVNEEGCHSLGYTREELCSMVVFDIDPDMNRETWTRGRAMLDELGATTIESLHQRRNGEIFPIQVIQNLMRFKDQELHVAFVQDITERKRLEELMIQSEKMLSVGGLAAGMAHEINNPLAGMMQTAGVMAGRLGTMDIPANRKAAGEAGTTVEAVARFMEIRGIFRMLDTINESGRRVAEIVENMLSFARKSDATVSTQDLGKLLDKTLELAVTDYDLKKKYDFKRIAIEKDYTDPPVLAPCENTKIQQVLLNILRNAAEATCDTASPRIVFRTRHEGDTAIMEIEDNGPGMDEDTRKKVFEPFFTTKPVGVGTGLGLSVSYFIVTENHGGDMTVESRPGSGARFIIRLPVNGRQTSGEPC